MVATRDPDGATDGDDDAGAEPAACVDRATYEDRGVTVRGMRQACDVGQVCERGTCVPEPVCAPGVTQACRFAEGSKHGLLYSPLGYGDHIYWIEGGTFDAVQNYQHDGAVMRAKVGVWEREEILTGLNLSDGAARLATHLEEQKGWLRLVGDRKPSKMDQIFLPDGSVTHPLGSRHAWCMLDEATSITSSSSTAYATVLATGEQRAVPPFSQCAVGDGKAWLKSSMELLQLDLETWETRPYPPEGFFPLLAAPGGRLLAITDHFLAVGTPTDAGDLTWKHAVDLLSFPESLSIVGDEIYWVPPLEDGQETVLLRANWADVGGAEVVAELWGVAEHHDGYSKNRVTKFGVTKGAVVWVPADRSALHYVPLPETR